jgi:hypothetical protein
MPFIGPLIAALSSLLLRVAGPLFAGTKLFIGGTLVYWFGRIMVGLGLYFFVVEPFTGLAMQTLADAFTGSADMLAWLGFLNIDRALSAIASAYAIIAVSRLVLQKTAAPAA